MRDAIYDAVLPRLTILYALEVPSAGGGTLFADMQAVWDALTETMRTQLLPPTGLHQFNVGPAGSAGICAGQAGTEQGFEDQRHPAVAVHPHSRRPILFVNPAHTHGFDGVEREAAWRLVEELPLMRYRIASSTAMIGALATS